MSDRIKVSGGGVLACWNPDGSLAWRKPYRNAPTTVGLQYFAGAGFSGSSQITTWYAGLINLTSFSTLAVGDTMATHSGWNEFTGYSGTRPTWANSGAGGIVSSTGPFTFPITSNGIIHGMFIVSSSLIGGTAGTLWCTAVLSSDGVVTAGQNLTGTYSITAAGA